MTTTANVKRYRERHDLVPVTLWWPRELVAELDAALAKFNVTRTKGLRTMVERRLRELRASAAAIPPSEG
jgi:hypothetical protein